ncbi:8900_t:CDS:2 [Entrophospora sp. SA101]|nr:8900_t:CDS:2 [Entrophospora sp. SA101]
MIIHLEKYNSDLCFVNLAATTTSTDTATCTPTAASAPAETPIGTCTCFEDIFLNTHFATFIFVSPRGAHSVVNGRCLNY